MNLVEFLKTLNMKLRVRLFVGEDNDVHKTPLPLDIEKDQINSLIGFAERLGMNNTTIEKWNVQEILIGAPYTSECHEEKVLFIYLK